MNTLEERLAYLEGAVEEHSRTVGGIRDAVVNLELRVDRRFEAVDRRFEAIDRRFEAIDRRFDAIDRRFDAIDLRFEGIDRRLDALGGKVDRGFAWVVGFQVTTMAAIVAALIAR